jgi:hypothetical protein
MSFDPCHRPLKIQESIGAPIPKMGIHLGVWGFIPSHSLTFPGARNATPKLHSWPTPSQALALITSPRLRLRQIMKSLLLYGGFSKSNLALKLVCFGVDDVTMFQGSKTRVTMPLKEKMCHCC